MASNIVCGFRRSRASVPRDVRPVFRRTPGRVGRGRESFEDQAAAGQRCFARGGVASFRARPRCLRYGLAVEDDAVAVVNESIEDRIGDRAIAEVSVPLIDRQLTGHERGATIVAIVENFRQVADRLLAQRREAEVIDQRQVGIGELSIQCRTFLHRLVAGPAYSGIGGRLRPRSAHGRTIDYKPALRGYPCGDSLGSKVGVN